MAPSNRNYSRFQKRLNFFLIVSNTFIRINDTDADTAPITTIRELEIEFDLVFSDINELLPPREEIKYPTNDNILGNPSFIYKNQTPKIIIEVDANINEDSIMRLCAYLQLNNVKYGILSSWNQSCFVKRLGEDRFSVSQTIDEARMIPFRRCVWFMIHLSRNDNEQFLPVSSNIPNLQIDGRFLGKGRMGIVRCCYYNGTPVAVKFLDTFKSDKSSIMTEIANFQKLSHLQGDAIPRFIESGCILGFIMFFVMELGERWCFDSDKELAAKALKSLHNEKITHGDVRKMNFIFIVVDGRRKGMLIDLEGLQFGCNEKYLGYEFSCLNTFE